MSPPRRGPGHPAVAGLAALLLLLTGAVVAGCAPVPALGGDAPTTLPYGVALRVNYGPQGGPEALRHDLAAELRAAVEGGRCFERVLPRGVEAGVSDLRFDVVLAELDERVEFEGSLAQAHDPRRPPGEVGRAAQVRARVLFELTLGEPSGAVVRRKRFNGSASRSAIPGEDPRVEARLTLVDHLVHRAREFVCQGSAERWRRRIERARTKALEDR